MSSPISRSSMPSDTNSALPTATFTRVSGGGLSDVPTRTICLAPPPSIVLKVLEIGLGILTNLGFFVLIAAVAVALTKAITFCFSALLKLVSRQPIQAPAPNQDAPPLPSSLAVSTLPQSPVSSNNSTASSSPVVTSEVEEDVTLPNSPKLEPVNIEFMEFDDLSEEEIARGNRIKALSAFLPEAVKGEQFNDPVNFETMSSPLFHFRREKDANHTQVVTRNGTQLFVQTRHHHDASSLIGVDVDVCPTCRHNISEENLALNITLQKKIEREMIKAFNSEDVTTAEVIGNLQVAMASVTTQETFQEALVLIPEEKILKEGIEKDLREWLTHCLSVAVNHPVRLVQVQPKTYSFKQPQMFQTMYDNKVIQVLQGYITDYQSQGYSAVQAKGHVFSAIDAIPENIPASRFFSLINKERLRSRMLRIWTERFAFSTH